MSEIVWVIAPQTRCDLHFWSGINFSGEHREVQIHPAGGRQGDKIDGFPFQSVAISGPVGTRVIFALSLQDDWEARPWRAVEIRKGLGYMAKTGMQAVRVPDLDWVETPDARRSNPEFEVGFPEVKSMEERPEWTYGNGAGAPLKGRVVSIRVDRVERPAPKKK